VVPKSKLFEIVGAELFTCQLVALSLAEKSLSLRQYRKFHILAIALINELQTWFMFEKLIFLVF